MREQIGSLGTALRRSTSIVMRTIPNTARSMMSALTVALIALAMICGGLTPAAAQMQQGLSNSPQNPSAPPPQILIPHSQGKETSTLELPSMPAKQGGDSLNIPPQVPQTGQSLEVPTRELRQQPGYEQVTVTVTEPSMMRRVRVAATAMKISGDEIISQPDE